MIHTNCTRKNDSVCPKHPSVGVLWGLPWRANDEHVGFDLRMSLSGLMPVLFLIFAFLSTREHKTLVLVLTVSNRIVCSQNS